MYRFEDLRVISYQNFQEIYKCLRNIAPERILALHSFDESRMPSILSLREKLEYFYNENFPSFIDKSFQRELLCDIDNVFFVKGRENIQKFMKQS